MDLDPTLQEQALKLFLTEALELCQQVEEGILLAAHSPSSLALQSLGRRVQVIQQGADQIGFHDLQPLTMAITALLTQGERGLEAGSYDLLHQLCDLLHFSLLAHRSSSDPINPQSPYDFVLHAVFPKALEVIELTVTQPLPEELQAQLLRQQTQWLHSWSRSLNLVPFETLATATLDALYTCPQTAQAFFPIALAGYKIAYSAVLQSSTREPMQPLVAVADVPPPQLQTPSLPVPAVGEEMDVSQHLVGLAHQTIFCVATDSIQEIVLSQPSQLVHIAGQEQLRWQNYTLELHRFTDVWTRSVTTSPSQRLLETAELILVLKEDSRLFALALEVDRIITESTLSLMQPSELAATRHPCCYGWSSAEDGSWLAVVDVNCLFQNYLQRNLQQPSVDNPFDNDEDENSASIEAPLELGIELGIELGSDRPRGTQAITETLFGVPEVTLPPQNILIIDDSRVIRRMLVHTLQGAGYEVLQAEDGQAAITHLQQNPDIRLAICDIEMSNLNGFEFLRHRLQEQRWQHIPVLMLSSHSSEEYRKLARKLGAAGYLTIPYDPPTLLTTIQDLLSARR
jgi:CheY-like chemotaxis protein